MVKSKAHKKIKYIYQTNSAEANLIFIVNRKSIKTSCEIYFWADVFNVGKKISNWTGKKIEQKKKKQSEKKKVKDVVEKENEWKKKEKKEMKWNQVKDVKITKDVFWLVSTAWKQSKLN